MIGRSAELITLEMLLANSFDKNFSAAIISGEAGIGKSRLIREFLRVARAAGARTIVGNCVPLTSGTLPFGPFIEVLRQARRWGDEESVHILDELRAELDQSEYHPDDESVARAAVTAAFARTRPFGLAVRLLETLARKTPLVLVIEDAHWADSSSLDLLRYLMATLGDEPILLIVTFRWEQLPATDPHLEQLTELGRAQRTVEIPLGPLVANEVSELVQSIVGEAPSTALVDRLYLQSDGNAFFVEELLAAGRAGESDLDTRVRDVMLSRLLVLSPAAHKVLQIAAAVGRTVPHDLLASAWAGADGLNEAIRETVDAHVLVLAAPGDAYTFRHALMCDAVYADMLPGESRGWHARIANCLSLNPWLSSGQSMSQAAELAHHWYAAGDWPRTLHASLEAARSFTRSHAYAESYEQFQRVLKAWELTGQQDTDELNHIALLTNAAEAARLACDAQSAIGLLEKALDAIDVSRDRMLAASLLERLGRCLWEDGHTDQAAAAHQRGSWLLTATPDSELRARLLAAEGRMLMVLSRYQDSLSITTTAVQMARLVKAATVEIDASITLGVDLVMTGDAPAGLALLRESCSMAARDGGVEDVVRAYGNLAAALGRLSDFEQSVLIADEGLAELGRRKLPRTVGGLLLTNVCESMFALGRWDEAEQRILDALQSRLPAIDAAFLYRTLGEIRTARGQFDMAQEALGRARDFAVELREPQYTASLHVAFAMLALERCDYQTARSETKNAQLANNETGLEDIAILACAVGLQIESEEATAGSGRRQSERSSFVAAGAQLWALAQDHAESAKSSGVDLRDCDAALALCAAEWSRLRGDSDDKLWAASAEAWRARNKPYVMATSLFRQAEVVLSRQQRAATRRLLVEVLQVATQLHATPLGERVRELAHRARLDLVADPVERTSPKSAIPGNPALTPREVDVLGYLVEGMTNREIAALLFISLKTVDKHVSNLMDKLQVRNRVEAATIGHRLLQQASLPNERTGAKANSLPAQHRGPRSGAAAGSEKSRR